MSGFGDDGSEMPRPDPFDDDAIDALLAGTNSPADAAVSSFIEDLRAAAVAVPTPSPVLSSAIAAGGISAHEPPVTKRRKLKMKIQGFLAGLGVAGKVALGVGVAAAATTGAGAAGVLPGPVQHVVSKAVDAVSPFSVPDGDHHAGNDGNFAGGESTTTTTVGEVTTTTKPSEAHDGTGEHNGVVTPTTLGEHHGDGETTTTVAHDGNGSHEGDGGNETTPTTVHNGDGDHHETPTTEHHGDGDNNNPESLTIHCERVGDGAKISCSWSAATNADHDHYVLLRVGDGHNRVVLTTFDGVSFVDTVDLKVGTVFTYGYRVDSLRADGSVAAHSPMVNVECCSGAAPTTTTTIHHEDGTTTTTLHG